MNEKADSAILCHICGQPVELTFDTAANEKGQTVHESCYVEKFATPKDKPETPAHRFAIGPLSPMPRRFLCGRV